MSVDLLEESVFSKPYFDNAGLIVAVNGDTLVGFAHGAFGFNEDGSDLATERGVIGMVMVRPTHRRQGIGRELLRRAEQYLRDRGSHTVCGGGISRDNPFYTGLYGRSDLPGVWASYKPAAAFFSACGYQEVGHTRSLECDLHEFRPTVNREQMQIRRRSQLAAYYDPPPASWWRACTLGGFTLIAFELKDRDGGPTIGAATFWRHDHVSTRNGDHAVGLLDVTVSDEQRRQGLATFLLGESFRQLHSEGYDRVEAQVDADDTSAQALFDKRHFQPVDRGVTFRKEL